MSAIRGLRPALRRHLLPVLAVAAVAATVRGIWVAVVHAQPVSDFLFYYQSAAGLAAGHGYSILGHPTAFFPVGYPAFLAALFVAFGTSLHVVWVSGVVLWTLAAVLAYFLGVELQGRATGVIAGLLVAVAPDFLVFTGLAASESLFVPLLAVVCLLLGLTPAARLGWRRAALVGVVLGLAVLVRSSAILLPLVFGAGVVLLSRSRRGLLAAAVLVVATGLVLAPWVVRNRLVMGATTISTNGGYTLWMGLNPLATGGPDVKGGLPPWPIASARSEVSQDAVYQRRAVDWTLAHPGQALRLVPRKLQFLLRWKAEQIDADFQRPAGVDRFRGRAPRDLSTAEELVRRGLTDTAPAQALFHYVFLVLGAAGIALGVAWRRPVAGWIATVLVFWIVFNATLIHGQSRFLTSVSPLLAPGVSLLFVTVAAAAATRLSGSRRAAPPAGQPAGPGGPAPVVPLEDGPEGPSTAALPDGQVHEERERAA